MRSCDWTELKDGDVFYIDKLDPKWCSYIGFYLPAGTLVRIRGGWISTLDGHTLARGPMYSSYTHLKQPVVVIEPSEMKLEDRLGSIGTRVNNASGADPEIFVVRGEKRTSLLPAFQFLPTQKEARSTYPEGTKSYSYCDGFAAESYTYPQSCHGYMIDYLRNGLSNVLKAARKFDRTARLTIKNTFIVPAVTMAKATDEQAALGCTPSLNAYNDEPKLPMNGRDFPLRFAGGHAHMGVTGLSLQKAALMAKGCDIIAALPAVGIFASVDTAIRRQYYGRAGEFRKPSHGFEYRTLSNGWLATPEIAHLMFNLVRCGAKVGYNDCVKLLDIPEEKVREIINFCDVKEARKWVAANKNIYLRLLTVDGSAKGSPNAEKAFTEIVQGGIEALFPDYGDIEKNWILGGLWDPHSNNLRASWGAVCNRQSL